MRLGLMECHVPFTGHRDLDLVSSVIYHFCDLNLISTIIVSEAYLIYYLREESHICCMDTSLDADVSHTILGHCDLDL